MNNQNTNELIKQVAYDVTLLTGLWGVIITGYNAVIIECYNPLNNNRTKLAQMALTLQIVGIVTTSLVAYKYS